MSERLDHFNPEAFMEWARLEKYMYRNVYGSEHPAVDRFKELKMLSHDGGRSGVEKDGLNYPVPSRNNIMALLAPFIEDIEALKEPVVMLMPDPTRYGVKELNKLERSHAIGRYNFNDAESVYFPDPNAVSPRWRYENAEFGRVRYLDQIFQNSDGERVPQIGHHYERPFEGWSVFVCEKECEQITPDPDDPWTLGQMVASDSPYLQMTAKEAYIMKALGLAPMDEEDAEVMLGQYDPKKGQFPILWHEMSPDMSRYIHSVSGVSLDENIGKYTRLPRNKTRRLVARRGFRLPSFAKVAERICSNEVYRMRAQIAYETRQKTGKEIYGQLDGSLEWGKRVDQPMDRMTALIFSVRAMQAESRRAVDALLRIASESTVDVREREQLQDELAQAREDIRRRDEIIRNMQNQPQQPQPSRRSPQTESGLNITPESLKHLDAGQLKKLFKSLTQFFHPDRFNGVSETEKALANDQYRRLKEMLEAEMRRKG